MCVQLQARARVNFWWETLHFSHVWGLLSLRQVRAGAGGMVWEGVAWQFPCADCERGWESKEEVWGIHGALLVYLATE
jgi:hypothetical protein